MRARRLAVALVFCLGIAPVGAAAAGPACHCFRDREFDPGNPDKSDEYLLATAANTLLAAAYGIPKRDIVEARMTGISGEDLWITAFAAHRQGTDRGVLLKARAATASWPEVFRSSGRSLEPLGPRFVAALAARAGDTALARLAAAETLAARLGTPWPELQALVAADATLQETVLSALLGVWSARSAPEVYADVKGGRSGWSRLLAASGRAPKQMEAEIPKILRAAPR